MKTIGRRDLGAVLLKPASSVDPRRWLVEAERCSRTFYVEALRKCGFHGNANRRPFAAGVPEEIERGLSEMVFTSQLIALRQLHELVRSDGESPARLGALVRGYANLGMLTEFHWHPAHKVFKARALLYAQRMVAREPDPAYALWHRAYAFAAAGLHALALDDLKTAEKNSLPGDSRPDWGDLIEAHCRFDLDRLNPEQAGAESRQLAGLLRYLAIELGGDDGMIVAAGTELVQEMPECYRIHDGVCEHSGSAAEDGMFTEWLLVAGKTIYPRLLAAPDLSARAPRLRRSTTRAIPRTPSGRNMSAGRSSRALAEEPSADGGEPSWACLGRLIAELSFVQVSGRVRFETSILDSSADEFVKESAPLVSGHAPEREVLEQLPSIRSDQTAGDLSALISRLDKRDRGMVPAIRRCWP